MKKTIFTFCILLLSICGQSIAATYYISLSGTDDGSHGTGPGTDAWATLNYALKEASVAHGDEIIIDAGTYDAFYDANTNITPTGVTGAHSSFTVPVIIKPAESASVTINIPASVGTAFIVGSAGKYLKFEDITFSNSNSTGASPFRINQNNFGIHLAGCTINMGGSSNDIFMFTGTDITVKLFVENTVITQSGGQLVDFDIGGGGTKTINFDGVTCYNYNSGMSIDAACSLEVENSIFTHCSTGRMFALTSENCTISIHDNILAVGGAGYSEIAFYPRMDIYDYYITNPSEMVIENNVIWTFETFLGAGNGDHLTTIFDMSDYGGYLAKPFVLSESNSFQDPGFDEADIALNDFSGANFVIDRNIGLSSKYAFHGDSIFWGIVSGGDDDTYRVSKQFNQLSGLPVSDYNISSIPGAEVAALRFLTDYMMLSDRPQTVFVSVGINNFDENGTYTAYSGMDATQMATQLELIGRKIQLYGATPIFMGVTAELNGFVIESRNINTAVKSICISNGWTYYPILDYMERAKPFNWQSVYYDDLSKNLHPGIVGHTAMAQAAINSIGKIKYDIDISLGTHFR